MSAMRYKVVCCLVASIALASCATQPGSQPQDPLAQANAHFTETVATGALVGCAVGAGLGYLLAGKQGALLGCGGGAVGGGALGYGVASNNQAQAQNESSLNGQIAQANQDAMQARQATDYAWQQTYAAQSEARILSAKVRSGQMSVAQYDASLASYQHTSQEMQSLIHHIDVRQASYEATLNRVPQARSTQLVQDTNELAQERQSLESSYQKMQQVLAERPRA